jgi:diguanylate cyclase (GGDEF)-like protein
MRPFAKLGVKLALVLIGAMVGLAFVATFVFSDRLTDAYQEHGESNLQSIARTWDDGFHVTSLNEPDYVQERIARLRALNPGIHKVSVSWRDPAGGETRMVQDGHSHDPDGAKRDVTTHRVEVVSGRRNRAPIEEGVTGYREVSAADGAHYAEMNVPLRRGGKVRAMLELHYDLKTLDQALAQDKRTVTVAAALAALTLALLANVLLARTLLSPLARLRAATQRLGAGERGHRLGWKRQDEIGLLAQDFDRMAEELDNAHEHLEALALKDPLTGLLNHRAFKERLEQELRRAERERYVVSVVALDVDNFKDINDQHGHAAGDASLRELAGAFRLHLRPSDICGRIGGDEFCLAVVRSTAEETEEIVDRLRRHVARLKLGPGGQRITISAGIAEFPRHTLGREELMHLADGAMYWAKSAGRNRSCIFTAERDFALSAQEQAARAAREGLINTVHALAKAVDAKDGYTNMHSHRVGDYAYAIAQRLGMEGEKLETIRTAGVLHDVGKIGISDRILQKPGSLTPEEWAVMRRHSELGRDIIAGAGMTEIADYLLHLHERYDGKGYPNGLAGADIPLESRILHVADALEAMTSSRVYRSALPVEEALAEIERCRGNQMDPDVADALLALVREGELEVGEEEGEDAVSAEGGAAAIGPVSGPDIEIVVAVQSAGGGLEGSNRPEGDSPEVVEDQGIAAQDGDDVDVVAIAEPVEAEEAEEVDDADQAAAKILSTTIAAVRAQAAEVEAEVADVLAEATELRAAVARAAAEPVERAAAELLRRQAGEEPDAA